MPDKLDPGQDERGRELIEDAKNPAPYAGTPYSQQTPEQQYNSGMSDGTQGGPTDPDRFSSAGEEDNYHTNLNPDHNERRRWKNGERFKSDMTNRTPNGGMKPGTSGASKWRNMTRKKVIITAVTSIVTVIVSIITFILSIPFQILHMAENLLHYNFDPSQHTEQTAHRKIIARLFQEQQHANGGRKSATGRPVHDKLVNMKINRFNKLLAKQGMALKFDAQGTLIGIEKDGKLTTDLSDKSVWEKRGAVGDLVHDIIGDSTLKTLQRVKYTRILRFHARVSWRFWTREKAKNIKDVANAKIRQGATESELREKSSGNNQEDAKARAEADKNGTSDAAEAYRATQENFDKTGSKRIAIRAGASVLQGKLTKTFGITGIIALVCTIKEMADQAAENGYIERADQLIRAGNLMLTMVDQMKDGTLNLDDFGVIMEGFNGDAYAPADSLDRKGFDQSAAWKRMQGQPVVTDASSPNYNPDLSKAAEPDGFWLHDVVSVMDTIFDSIPGAKLVCAAATSAFGFVLQIGEIALAIISGGAEAAISIGLQTAVSLVIFNEVVPAVLEAAASLAISGTENAVNQFLQADAGLALSSADYSRSMGGRALSDAEQRQLSDAANQENMKIAQEKGWIWRTFDPNNYQSAFSRAFAQVPTTGNRIYTAVASMPHTFASTFSTLFLGLKPAAAYPTSMNTYHFQYIGFTPAELEKYDFDDNEAFLTEKIPGTNVTRLAMLGDPTNYTPANGEDTNHNDLMHCFVNKYRSPNDIKQNDAICHSIATLTNRDGGANNPSDQEIVATIYCKNNGVCNLKPNDDLLRFRLEMLYAHIATGLDCLSTDEDCLAGSGLGAAPGSATGGVANGTAQELAKQILANPKITWQQAVDKADMQKVADGKPVVFCQVNGPLNTKLLQVIATAGQNFSFSINAIASGHYDDTKPGGCDGGFHDKGRAVDFGNVNGVVTNEGTLGSNTYRNFAQFIVGLLPVGGGIGQSPFIGPLSPAPSRYFNDTPNHVHVDVGASAP